MDPQISIIIPAHNEVGLIEKSVRSAQVAASRLGVPYEIIVVNDGSTDATAERALACGATVLDVHRRKISAVRNDGARIARGAWLVFLDGDTWMSADVLEAVRRSFERGAVGGGSGVVFDGVVPMYARLMLCVLVPLFRVLGMATGCFIYATREAFAAVGGFDESLFASEEVAFSKAMKKHGKFVVLRERVTTSGRKLRQYSPGQLFGVILSQAIRGPRGAWKSRGGLDVWYNAPRESRDDSESGAQ